MNKVPSHLTAAHTALKQAQWREAKAHFESALKDDDSPSVDASTAAARPAR
jgi:uncharacterized protein HemY